MEQWQQFRTTAQKWLVNVCLIFCWSLLGSNSLAAQQELSQLLSNESAEQLAADIVERGNAARGALIFYRPEIGCVKCHDPAGKPPADWPRPREFAT